MTPRSRAKITLYAVALIIAAFLTGAPRYKGG